MSTFFGLGPAYRPALHKQIFQMVYHAKGGFTHKEVYNLPIWLRRFYFKELETQLKAEEEAQRRASKGKSPNMSKPSIPSFSKPSMPSRRR